MIKLAIRLNKYPISEKSGTTYSINHNFAKIRIDSYDSLPTEKILTFHNVITLIKALIFLEKGSYKDKSNTKYFCINVCIL